MLPKNLPLTREEITRLIEATGWNKTEVGKMLGVVDTTVGRWMKGQAEPDPQNEARLRELRPHPEHKDKYAAYIRDAVARAGDGQASSQPSAVPTFDPEALASVLAQKLDADGIAQTVAGVVMATLPKVRVLARMVSVAVAGTISRVATGVVSQIATLQENLGQVVALLEYLKNKLDSLPRLDSDELARKLAQEVAARMPKPPEQTSSEKTLAAGVVRTLLPYLVGCTALIAIPLAILAFALFQATAPFSASGASRFTRGGGVAEEAARGGNLWNWADRLVPGMGEQMGERKVGRPMPHSPLPGQAVAPCQGSEDTLYGACWVQTSKTAPCPPDQFQEANKCYLPVRADPNIPIPVGTGLRPGQEMPTGERHDAGMPTKEEP